MPRAPISLPNDAAIVRPVGALMRKQCDEWIVTRRYFSLEHLARSTDAAPPRLPATAA